MVPLFMPWLALVWDFKVTIFFDIEYLINDSSYYRTSIGSHRLSIDGFIFNDLRGSLTRFSRSRYFWSHISQNGQSYSRTVISSSSYLFQVTRKATKAHWTGHHNPLNWLEHTYIHSLSNGTTFNDLKWPLDPDVKVATFKIIGTT